MLNNPINPSQIKEKEVQVVKKWAEKRENVLERFPLLFTMLTTFGVVATFYGFEHLIDQSDLLANNPIILLIIGTGTLIFTGALYKKLG